MKDNTYNHPSYINIPFFVLQDEKLDFFHKILFSLFWSFYTCGRKINASNGYLSSLLKVGERHIQTGIKQLEDFGYIARKKIKHQRYIEVLYTVSSPIAWDESPEDGNLESVDSTACSQARSTDRPPHDLQIATPRSTDRPYIKDNNKENNKEKSTPTSATPSRVDNSILITIKEMLNDNPHNLPQYQLEEWLLIRKKKKSPLTHTAWNRANSQLSKLKSQGLDPKDCFEQAVARGWTGIESRFFEQEIKSNASKSKTDIDKEIRERELKAQELKRQEFEASKGFVRNITQHIGISEYAKIAAKERANLGMSPFEYHQYTLSKSHSVGVP